MPIRDAEEIVAGFIEGVRVIEIGNELGEYCGKVLAGLGADVVRVEPPGGEVTRTYGPFYHDSPDPDRSLYFWHYNLGKRSVVIDLDSTEGCDDLIRLVGMSDVVIDSRPRGYLSQRGIDEEVLRAANPGLIWARITPFGDSGPWADYESSDLIQLALGGMMMNCGYDPDPSGFYETPPIAPQMWQSYHMAGEMTAFSIVSALIYQLASGCGQLLSTSVHQVVSQNTETDLPSWALLRTPHHRVTCRHSMPQATSGGSLARTKDGRWMLPYQTYAGRGGADTWRAIVALLKDYGVRGAFEDPKFAEGKPEDVAYMTMLVHQLIGSLMNDRDVWRKAQDHGLPWAPIRRPEENVEDEHWKVRDAFYEVYHDELDEGIVYTGGKWLTEGQSWRRGPRPPLIGEHTEQVSKEWAAPAERVRTRVQQRDRVRSPVIVSKHNKPFALSDVRVIDLSWMLASAGAGRFLAAMGAEVIKVEHESRPDGMRKSARWVPPSGGRAERDRATGPIAPVKAENLDQAGNFMEINAGKLGISLNLKHPAGREILEGLIRSADMIVEGFSPGTMIRMGLGYEDLRKINPSIIYVQQSGLGEQGTYGRVRTYGPTAQAITGISDMSGLPDPFPPAGIGYSYLDWFGAYNMALAMLAALYRRDVTGEGCHIDASQGEAGLYLTGTAILDYTVNGRQWSRYGNRSPYKEAAPHGAYRTEGIDRWIAIAAFTEDHWKALVDVLDLGTAAADERFATLARRVQNQNALDALVDKACQTWDGYVLMEELQRRHVPSGVCQTAEERFERDPQLRHLEWMVELDQSEIGRWPVREHPVKFSETPAYMGGRLDRSGPNYGEDNEYVLTQILRFTKAEIEELRRAGAF